MHNLRRVLLLTVGIALAACTSDNVTPIDGGNDGTTITDAQADTFDGNCFGTSNDAACWLCPNGPSFGLTWNEGCSGNASGFIIQWGLDEAGYPFSADAGDPCDAAACPADAAAQQSCSYDLRGLEAGTWCIQVEAYNDAGTSTPSNLFCGALPPHCP